MTEDEVYRRAMLPTDSELAAIEAERIRRSPEGQRRIRAVIAQIMGDDFKRAVRDGAHWPGVG